MTLVKSLHLSSSHLFIIFKIRGEVVVKMCSWVSYGFFKAALGQG